MKIFKSTLLFISLCYSILLNASAISCYEFLESLISHREIKNIYHQFDAPLLANNLNELEELYGGGGFIRTYNFLDSAQIDYIKDYTLALADNHLPAYPTPHEVIEDVFTKLKQIHSQTAEGIDNSICTVQGFCYARATVAHMLGTMAGVPQENMKKIWIVGDLLGDEGNRWDYHVALAIKTQNSFMVLDTNYGLKDISSFYHQFIESDKKLPMIYISQPTRIAQFATDSYSKKYLFPAQYDSHFHHGYFESAFDQLDILLNN